MFGLSQFLEKFKNLQVKESLFRTIVHDAVKKHTGIEIPLADMQKRSHEIIFEKLSSAARSVIFMKKQHILKDINEHEVLKHIKDLR